MKIAISNIAWSEDDEPRIIDKIARDSLLDMVEVAPTKRWSDPTVVSRSEAIAYKDWWRQQGFGVIAFQSLLFTRPDLKLFGSSSDRAQMSEYMKRFLQLAGWMEVRRLVFGSPKNRLLGHSSKDKADKIATDFFSELADEATNNGVVLCIEPNASQYGCDYITTASEGESIVRRVGKPGFRLHLDTACMTLAGDDIKKAIYDTHDILSHFHASSPMLEKVGESAGVDHYAAATALRAVSYDGYVSIEMKPDPTSDPVERTISSIRYIQNLYG